MASSCWQSPDGKIKKTIIKNLKNYEYKPTENSVCKIKFITDIKAVTIGDTASDFERILDNCIMTMYQGEVAQFIVILKGEQLSFELELIEMDFAGFVYEWDATQKCKYAKNQNEKGKLLFAKNELKEAALKFNKALKIVLLIPIDAQDPPEEIDGVKITEIRCLKANLYNNLASCFFKNQQWDLVVQFCEKVFDFDGDNVKALYRASVAYIHDRNYENADECLKKILSLEPANKAALEQHKFVNLKLMEAREKCDLMAKRMIGSFLNN